MSRTNRTHVRDALLERLKNGQSISGACKAVGIGRSTAYEWRDADEQFRAAWDGAVEEGTDTLEDEAYRRAVTGVDVPIIYQGKITGTYKEYSDHLLVVLLKSHRPEKYRERASVDHSGRVRLEDIVAASSASD